ncbi:MAG TPA: hypothetical protein DCL61_14130 [Cyanobacteria bacterium UBA12227]|nr:hypothetical protein [Cyanobacteria bacterium UBA12227]HAX88097.1 hypothetical protein [Cyanobacteria bacterium UBA11370]
MASLVRILFTQDTALKQEPIQSSLLPSNKLQKVPAGTLLVLQSYSPPDNTNHIRLSLQDIEFKGTSRNWYAFTDHVYITKELVKPVETVDQTLAKQSEKDFVKMTVYRSTLPPQGGLIKLVFKVDTVIKRSPVQANLLNANSMQQIPAGTQLVLLTEKPDTLNTVKLPIKDSHVKFTLKDIEFKGFSQDWYVFIQHAGLQLIG